MIKQLRPGHSLRSEIIKQRISLTPGQRIASAHRQHAKLFEQLASSSANCRTGLLVDAVVNRSVGIGGIELPAGKSVEASEERQLVAATNQKNFGIFRIGIGPKQNYSRGVFRCG